MEQELEYVLKVWEKKSFTKAAEQLFITQPALSIAIKKVEDTIGMPVFDRSIRPLSLTPAGEAYLQYIKDLKDLENNMNKQMEDLKGGNTGEITLGVTHYLGAYILPHVLSGFAKTYPNITLHLVEAGSAKLQEMLAGRELDITFNCSPDFVKDYERYRAFTDHILLAVPKDLPINSSLEELRLSAKEVMNGKHLEDSCPCASLNSFQNEPFILLQAGNNLHSRAKALFNEAGFSPKVKLELSQLVTSYRLAESGLGVAFVSDRLECSDSDRLYFYKLKSEQTNRLFYMVLPDHQYVTHAVRAFIKYCEQHI